MIVMKSDAWTKVKLFTDLCSAGSSRPSNFIQSYIFCLFFEICHVHILCSVLLNSLDPYEQEMNVKENVFMFILFKNILHLGG